MYKILNFRLQDKENLSEYFFILLKNIWWSEKLKIKNNPEIENLTAEELSHKIFSVESRITYLQVHINIYV
jgi:hypothetical protein